MSLPHVHARQAVLSQATIRPEQFGEMSSFVYTAAALHSVRRNVSERLASLRVGRLVLSQGPDELKKSVLYHVAGQLAKRHGISVEKAREAADNVLASGVTSARRAADAIAERLGVPKREARELMFSRLSALIVRDGKVYDAFTGILYDLETGRMERVGKGREAAARLEELGVIRGARDYFRLRAASLVLEAAARSGGSPERAAELAEDLFYRLLREDKLFARGFEEELRAERAGFFTDGLLATAVKETVALSARASAAAARVARGLLARLPFLGVAAESAAEMGAALGEAAAELPHRIEMASRVWAPSQPHAYYAATRLQAPS